VERTEDISIAVDTKLLADGSEQIAPEWGRVPCDPMRKLKLLIVRYIPWPRLSNSKIRLGG
jgi:hypothetical protein